MSNKILTIEEDVFDLSISCTKDQAVMRMLGWGEGNVFKRAIPIDADGNISPEDLMQMHPGTMTLLERLQEREEHARKALTRGVESDVPYKEFDRLVGDREEVRELAALARELLMDIDAELAKGKDSALHLDEEATNRTGITHIKILSLDKWAVEFHSAEAADISPEPAGPLTKNDVEVDESLLNVRGGMSPTSARSFLVTFALLLEQFVVRAGPNFKSESGTGVNVESIAKLLSSASLPHARAGRFLQRQSVSSIEARIMKTITLTDDALSQERTKVLKSK